MNNLLFTVLIIALLYYFFYYLPHQKKLSNTNPPLTKLTHSQLTQTDPHPIEKTVEFPGPQQELEELKLQNSELRSENKDYQTRIKAKETQITNLQTEIRDLAQRPFKPTNSKGTQTDELTTTLDNLIKDIQDLNNSL